MNKYKVIVRWEPIEVEVLAKTKKEAKEKAIGHPRCAYPSSTFSYIPDEDVERISKMGEVQ